MFKGELKIKSADYQSGHSSGAIRVISYVSCYFMTHRQRLYTKRQVLEILENEKYEFLDYCHKFGMNGE